MAEPTYEDVGVWLRDNPDKKGTTDYVHMANAYRALHPDKPSAPPPEPGSAKSFTEDLWGRAKAGLGISDGGQSGLDWFRGKAAPTPAAPAPGSENVPNLEDLTTAQRLTSDPYSAGNTASRFIASRIGGIADIGIGGYNALARTVGSPKSQFEYVTPKLLENAGAADLPPDASWPRRLAEGALQAFGSGGAGAAGSILGTARQTAAQTGQALPVLSTAAKMAVPTVAPVLAGTAAGEGGGLIGKYLGDEETGRYIGSLLGGSVLSLKPATQSIIHYLYAGEGAANAPQIAAAAMRQGVTPTAGMVGNDRILAREQRYSGMPGSSDVVQAARGNAQRQIGAAADASAAARGSVDTQPTVGSIGEKVSTAANQSAEALRGASDARQAQLQEWIGADAPVNVGPIFERGHAMAADPAANLTPSQRRGISDRLINELIPLITPNAAQPAPGIGHNGGPPITPSTPDVAPYGYVRGFRTELGKDINTPGGGRLPPASQLYEPTTTQMRDTAQRSGVAPADFDTIQNQTRAVERTTPDRPGGLPGDYPLLQQYVNADPAKAYAYLEGGRNNPTVPGILEATGHPRIGEIFGDLMRKISNETINGPGARGPANFDNAYSKMHQDLRATMLGDQLANTADQVSLARALNIPTSQGGFTRSVGGQGDAVINKAIGSESAGQLGAWLTGSPIGGVIGRMLGVFGPSGYRGQKASVLEGPTARNALTGGIAPGGIDALSAALTAIQAEQQQNRPVR